MVVFADEDHFCCTPSEYERKRATLITYLRMKVDESDWHGVSDAANDLRVLEAANHAIELEYAAATEAVKKIVADLTDRGGLGDEWGAIDPDIQQEICEQWRDLILLALAK